MALGTFSYCPSDQLSDLNQNHLEVVLMFFGGLVRDRLGPKMLILYWPLVNLALP